MSGLNTLEGAVELTLCMMRPFSLEDSGGNAIRIANRKACGLLAYLALSGNFRESRERLAGVLWSERAEEQARGSLRQCVKQLREIFDPLGITVFDAGRTHVSLEPDRIDTDVWQVLKAAEGGAVQDLLLDRKRLSESLLAGFEDLDPAFRVWLLVQRQSLHDRLSRALEDALQAAAASSDREAVRRLSEALINLDPTDEEAARQLMRASAELGDVPAALRVYNALWDVLGDEYDMEPSDSTRDLVAAIKLGQVQPKSTPPARVESKPGFADAPSSLGPGVAAYNQAASGAPRGPSKFVLVVDLFETPGVPESSWHVCEGFRHDLVSKLVRFRELSVIDGETWSVRHRQGHDDGPVYHVKAKFYQDIDTLNLIVTVVASDTGVYVLSDRFGVSLHQFFESQQMVVRRIAAVLNIHLSMERLNRVSGIPEVALDIYDRWLLGQSLGGRWRPENDERAEQIFRSCLADAPRFSPAYSSLAGILNARHHTFPGIRRSAQREAEALSLARQAVEIDPIDTRSQLCLAWSYAMLGHYNNAAVHFAMARDLNTSDAWTLVSAALGMAYCGSLPAALKFADEALQLGDANSPSHWGYHATIRFLCEDHEGCVEAADFAEDTIFYVPGWKAAALTYLGRVEEGQAEAARFVDLVSANWFGSEPATPAAITTWFREAFPIRDTAAKGRLHSAFMLAVAPLL